MQTKNEHCACTCRCLQGWDTAGKAQIAQGACWVSLVVARWWAGHVALACAEQRGNPCARRTVQQAVHACGSPVPSTHQVMRRSTPISLAKMVSASAAPDMVSCTDVAAAEAAAVAPDERGRYAPQLGAASRCEREQRALAQQVHTACSMRQKCTTRATHRQPAGPRSW